MQSISISTLIFILITYFSLFLNVLTQSGIFQLDQVDYGSCYPNQINVFYDDAAKAFVLGLDYAKNFQECTDIIGLNTDEEIIVFEYVQYHEVLPSMSIMEYIGHSTDLINPKSYKMIWFSANNTMKFECFLSDVDNSPMIPLYSIQLNGVDSVNCTGIYHLNEYLVPPHKSYEICYPFSLNITQTYPSTIFGEILFSNTTACRDQNLTGIYESFGGFGHINGTQYGFGFEYIASSVNISGYYFSNNYSIILSTQYYGKYAMTGFTKVAEYFDEPCI